VTGLSLCAGIGGLDLALHLAVETYRTVCYVEGDAFCQAVLERRMQEGHLNAAPIWPDLRSFDATPWRGRVDIVHGGPPCQPFSQAAGRGQRTTDTRNLLPHVYRIVAEATPAIVFLENVPGAMPYFYHVVLPGLRRLGYAVAAGLFTAAEVGAPHRRCRLFVLAHRHGAVRRLLLQPGRPSEAGAHVAWGRETLDDADRMGWEGGDTVPAWPPAPGDRDVWAAVLHHRPDLVPAVAAEPPFRRLADGRARRLGRPRRADQLRVYGNMVVPQQAARALLTLADELVTAR
jgi:DNA (cytosine-5)-methyltransferase 1